MTEATTGAVTDASSGESGVDFISLGALTHSAPALDLSFQLDPDADQDVRPS